MKIMLDTAYPANQPSIIPDGTTALLIYVGGDTPHPWQDSEIDRRYRYLLPTWVCSDPSINDPNSDGLAFLRWLYNHNVPKGCFVVLDLETAVNGPYVIAFNGVISRGGYKTIKYGSLDFIFQNPETDGGVFTAHPGALIIDPNCVATQFYYHGDWDLSMVADSVTLWDTRPQYIPPNTEGANFVRNRAYYYSRHVLG